MAIEVSVLRELFRNLQLFRAVYEDEGVDTIHTQSGDSWVIWDLEYLYGELHRLPRRQAQAIELCLVQNLKEEDAARIMGVSPTNPVAMYATEGLKKIVVLIGSGALPKFRADEEGVA